MAIADTKINGRVEMATIENASLSVTRQIGAEQRFLLHDIPWATYVAISDALDDRSSPRMTYDRGSLEFMTPSTPHEKYQKRLSRCIETMAHECELDFETAGQMTFRSDDLTRAFELDDCFWIAHEAEVRGKTAYDPAVDP